MTFLIPFTFFIAVLLLSIGVRIELEQRSPLGRLRQHALLQQKPSPEEEELRRPLLVRLFGPIAQRVLQSIARFSPPMLKDSIRRRIQAAGNPWHAQSEEVIFAKFILAATGLLLGWNVALFAGAEPGPRLLWSLGGLAAGFLVPDMMIQQKSKQRKLQIQRSLPYLLDLLCVSVEAGMAFDAAMQKVAEKMEGPLSEEFTQVTYEVRIGKLRRDALRDMRDRCGVEDLNTFIAAIIQAERQGLGIGQVLRVQSEQLRALRRERAREMAMKIPIKMLFPLVFLVLPALFIIILGPALINMMKNMGGGF